MKVCIVAEGCYPYVVGGVSGWINSMIKSFPNIEFILLTIVEECFQMALKWRNKNGCGEDPEKNSEMCVTLNSLRLYKELDLRGGVLRTEGNVVDKHETAAGLSIPEAVCHGYLHWNNG